MAVHQLTTGHEITLVANASLTALQYRIVQVIDDGDVDIVENNATAPIGVLMNKPASGAAARVAIVGAVVKCEAGATIDEDDWVTAVAGGRGSAAPSGTNVYHVGRALSPAASGEFFRLLVMPGHYTKA